MTSQLGSNLPPPSRGNGGTRDNDHDSDRATTAEDISDLQTVIAGNTRNRGLVAMGNLFTAPNEDNGGSDEMVEQFETVVAEMLQHISTPSQRVRVLCRMCRILLNIHRQGRNKNQLSHATVGNWLREVDPSFPDEHIEVLFSVPYDRSTDVIENNLRLLDNEAEQNDNVLLDNEAQQNDNVFLDNEAQQNDNELLDNEEHVVKGCWRGFDWIAELCGKVLPRNTIVQDTATGAPEVAIATSNVSHVLPGNPHSVVAAADTSIQQPSSDALQHLIANNDTGIQHPASDTPLVATDAEQRGVIIGDK